jgi:hypothetical protein
MTAEARTAVPQTPPAPVNPLPRTVALVPGGSASRGDAKWQTREELITDRVVPAAMTFDPAPAAAHIATAAEFERLALDFLAQSVGYDVAFTGLRGASPTGVGLSPDLLERTLRPGSVYEEELAPVKQAALAARGVAVDTEVLGMARVQQARYFRDLAKPLGGRHSLLGYFVLRGQVVGGLMLGRTGGPFHACEIAHVAGLLPSLTLGRVSYGLPGFARAPVRPRSSGAGWPWGERVLARREASDVEIRVRDRLGYREMVARDLRSGREMIWTRSGIDDAARSGWPYVDLLHVAAGLARRRERALFLGCGGAVSPRQFALCYPGIEIDVVEPEPHVIELARTFYGLDEIPRVAIHVTDGKSFLERTSGSWDIIVVDAYEGNDLSSSISDRGFLRLLEQRLHDGGTFAFNVIGSLGGSGPVHSIARAAASEFRDVRVLPVMTATEEYDPLVERNVVIIGVRH